MAEFKFIIIEKQNPISDKDAQKQLIFGYVNFHADLVPNNYHCLGGGKFIIDTYKHVITLYGSSVDYGGFNVNDIKDVLKHSKADIETQLLQVISDAFCEPIKPANYRIIATTNEVLYNKTKEHHIGYVRLDSESYFKL